MLDCPNILLISMDGLRTDALGCYGHGLVRTPHIDAIAAQGVRFGRAYCPQPACMPSRASLITGRYPPAHGAWGNGVPLRDSEITLPAVLAEHGYHTAIIGKAHHRPWTPDLDSYEDDHIREYDGDEPYYGFQHVEIADHAPHGPWHDYVAEQFPDWVEVAKDFRVEQPDGQVLGWKSGMPREANKTHYLGTRICEAIANRDDRKPFFMHASFIDPHHPYNPPEPFASMYDDVDFPTPAANAGAPDDAPAMFRQVAKGQGGDWWWKLGNAAQTQRQRIARMYHGEVAHVDAQVGRIMQTLRDTGGDDNSVVMLLADHGAALGEFGLLMIAGVVPLEHMVRIPLIVRPPAHAAARTDALASLVDIMPTVLDYAGVDCPLGVQGKSLRGVVDDPAPRVRDGVLVYRRAGQEAPGGWVTLITERYKLMIDAAGDDGWLIDRQADPDELHNLYNKPEAASLQAQLTRQLSQLMIRNTDPLPLRTARW